MQESIEKLFSKSMVVTFAILMGLGLWLTGLSSLLDNPAFAESVSSGSSDVTVRVKDIITLRILDSSASSEIDNLSLGLTPTPNGTFIKGSFNVDASTSNATGYKLYMTSIGTNPVNTDPETESGASGTSGSSGSTYTTNLINADSTVSDSIPTLAANSSVTEADFRVRNSSYKNKWGYSLASLDITDTSAITYTNIPAHNTNHEVGGSNSAVESDLTPITIGVNVSNSVASGTYKNALEFTAIANELPTEYSLKFNANLDGAGLDTEEARTAYHVEDMLDNLEAESYASSYSFTLPSGADNIPIKTNMVLREWNTRADGSGVSYQPGDNLELIVDDTDPYPTEATLYAIWTNDFFHLTYMQDMYPTVCAKLYTPSNAIGTNANAITLSSDNVGTVSGAGSTIAVADYNAYKNTVTANNTRTGDNQPYVAQRTLYDVRTDDGSNGTTKYVIRKLADGNCWMAENLRYALAANSMRTGSKNDRSTFTFSTGASCGTNNSTCLMNGNTAYGSMFNTWYYTGYAVTANQYTDNVENIDGSICPSGWILPSSKTYNPKKSYTLLIYEYLGYTETTTSTTTGYITLGAYPLNFIRAGAFDKGVHLNDTWAYYWFSESYGINRMRMFYININTVVTQSGDGITDGLTARCVNLS